MTARGTAPVSDTSKVEVGEVDDMSMAAAKHRIPLCRQPSPTRLHWCTRAAGHAEGEWNLPHGSSQHVAVGHHHRALEVWL